MEMVKPLAWRWYTVQVSHAYIPGKQSSAHLGVLFEFYLSMEWMHLRLYIVVKRNRFAAV